MIPKRILLFPLFYHHFLKVKLFCSKPFLHNHISINSHSTSRTLAHSSKMLHFQECILFIFISCSLLFHSIVQPSLSSAELDHNTVPAIPVQTDSQLCKLDISTELFGGVNEACGQNLDRARCCPVLAAWLYAAHARYALQPPAKSSSLEGELPMMPDDSQKCVNSLQDALVSKNIHIPRPNVSCDPIICFCGIRLHQASSLRCPAAFNMSCAHLNVTPTAAVRDLEKSCNNSSYSGCSKCLGALEKLKGGYKNITRDIISSTERTSKMLNRDCQLLGLTWLLARNKTKYIPTVSAVLRAMMYSSQPPHQSKCSSDQDNMPLAVDSLVFERAKSSSGSFGPPLAIMPLIIFSCLFRLIFPPGT